MRCIDCGEEIVPKDKRNAVGCSDCYGLMHEECAMVDARGALRCEAHYEKPPEVPLWEKTVGEA